MFRCLKFLELELACANHIFIILDIWVLWFGFLRHVVLMLIVGETESESFWKQNKVKPEVFIKLIVTEREGFWKQNQVKQEAFIKLIVREGEI